MGYALNHHYGCMEKCRLCHAHFLAGLQNIPKVYYEAAEIDGASEWKRFYRITLPLLSPTIFFILIIFMIGALQVFDTIIVLTNGGPGDASRSIVMYIYELAFQRFDMGYASRSFNDAICHHHDFDTYTIQL